MVTCILLITSTDQPSILGISLFTVLFFITSQNVERWLTISSVMFTAIHELKQRTRRYIALFSESRYERGSVSPKVSVYLEMKYAKDNPTRFVIRGTISSFSSISHNLPLP